MMNMAISRDYGFYLSFIDHYLHGGFTTIDPQDRMIRDMEVILKNNKQFFSVWDLIQLKILFTSETSYDIIGITSEMVDPSSLFTIIHPDDLRRRQLTRLKMISMAHELYLKRDGIKILSTNFRAKKPGGNYFNLLHQFYIFFSPIPIDTIFCLLVLTDISWFTEISNGIHYYFGKDSSYFRYPDPNLLITGTILSHNEYSVIQYLEKGFNTEQISKKLFLRESNIENLRRNIVRKSGKSSTKEVIRELKAQGLL